MHVLVIPSWYPRFEGDAGGSFFREQAIALAGRLNEVGVVYPQLCSLKEYFSNSSERRGFQVSNDEGVNLVSLDSFNLTPRFDLGIQHQWLSKGWRTYLLYVSRFGKPDIIHAHCALFAGHLACYISQREQIPFVVTEHSSLFANQSMSSANTKISENVFYKAQKRISVSNSLRILIEKKYPKSGKWMVIPNLVNDMFFKEPLPDANHTNKSLKLLNIAAMNPNKRQKLLLESLAICRKLGLRNVSLTIAGEGPELRNLERQVRSLDLEGTVCFKGLVARKEVPKLMTNHDCLVSTSKNETFGLVVAEALATGLHCISTNSGGPLDIIGSEDGCIVMNDSPESFANAILHFSNSKKKNLLLRQQLRDNCRLRFGSEVISNSLIQQYEDVFRSSKLN